MGLLVAPVLAFAQLPTIAPSPNVAGPITGSQSFINLVNQILFYVATLFWILAAVFVFYAAYLYLTAAGDEEKVKQASIHPCVADWRSQFHAHLWRWSSRVKLHAPSAFRVACSWLRFGHTAVDLVLATISHPLAHYIYLSSSPSGEAVGSSTKWD